MSSVQSRAFVIAVDGRDVGVAVAGRGGFHFVAADPDCRAMDGSCFRRVKQIERAARDLLKGLRVVAPNRGRPLRSALV